MGCGGTLLRHSAEGDEIHWLIMTTITEHVGFSKEMVDKRKKEIEVVAKKYDFTSYHQSHFITATLDRVSKNDLIDEISFVFKKLTPDTIYVPYYNDIHSDHGIVFDAVAACTKSFRYPFIRKVRVYETLSETEFCLSGAGCGFVPNLWIDISSYLEEKIEIMRLYIDEVGKHPFPRSEKNIVALATLRGATAGVEAAESFISLKEII